MMALLLVGVIAMASEAPLARGEQAVFMTELNKYPRTVTASAITTQTLITDTGVKLTCEESAGVPGLTLTGTLSEESTSLAMSPSYENCHATILKVPATVEARGCGFLYTAGSVVFEGLAEGVMHISSCEQPSEGMRITVGTEGNGCHLQIPEASPISGSVGYENAYTPPSGGWHMQIIAESLLFSVNYTGGTVCSGGTSEAVGGTITLSGEATAVASGLEGVTVE